jgi:hypothetical protein
VFVAAAAAGCTGLPVRPEPFECPERTRKLMDAQGWEDGFRMTVQIDDRFERDSRQVFRPGAEVVSIVPDRGVFHDRKLAPPGTKFWGRVYVDPQERVAKLKDEPAGLIVKYERAKLPGQEDFPVCIIGLSQRVYSVDKDGATTASNSASAEVTWSYPND